MGTSRKIELETTLLFLPRAVTSTWPPCNTAIVRDEKEGVSPRVGERSQERRESESPAHRGHSSGKGNTKTSGAKAPVAEQTRRTPHAPDLL